MRQQLVLGVVILLLATTLGTPNPADDSDTKPGSAGHHASVQAGSGSGQFLLTNNDNYGLQISHAPYSSGNEEVLPKPQKLRRRGPTHRSAEVATSSPTQGETYCAGCLPLTGQQSQGQQLQEPQPQQIQSTNDLRPPPQPQGVNVRQQLRRQHHQYQAPEGEQQNQQVTFSSGHNSQIGGQRQISQPQSDYTYSANLQNPGQASGRGWSSGDRNQGWQPQPQAKLTPPQQPVQPQEYQWGQKVIRQRQQSARSQSPPRQQNPNSATGQHLRIRDDGGYSFGYKAPDSSRQEQRSMDGTVSGSYAYTDPTGQEVQVDYRASPDQGYQAFGPTIPKSTSSSNSNPVPVSKYQVSGPVQDTPEVQAARAQFFESYNQQLKFIEQLSNAQNPKGRDTWAVPFGTQTQVGSPSSSNSQDSDSKSGTDSGNRDVVSVDSKKPDPVDDDEAEDATANPKKPIDFKLLPEPIAVPDSNIPSRGAETDEDDEQENDAVPVNREDEEPSSVPAPVKVPRKRVKGPSQPQNQDTPQAAYSFSVTVGQNQGQGGRGVQKQNQWPYWGNQGQNENQIPLQAQSQSQPMTVGYQYLPPQENIRQSSNAATMPNNVGTSYNYNRMVGASPAPQPKPWAYQTQNMVSSQQGQMNQVEMGDMTKPTSPAYFYYVSVGGNPQDYVTSSNLFNSGYPTSLKASLLGAIPQDGRHDAQVPHQNMGAIQNEVGTGSNPPVYLDMDPNQMTYQGYQSSSSDRSKDKQPLAIVGFIPGALVSLRNGGYVSVNSAAVSHSGNEGTSVRIGNGASPTGNGNRHQFPLFVFRDRD